MLLTCTLLFKDTPCEDAGKKDIIKSLVNRELICSRATSAAHLVNCVQ
jgi:hypothetical protein